MTKILLDADMLLFRATAATEIEVQLSEDVWTRHSELPEAREYYWDTVRRWAELFAVGLDDVIHCFTDRSAFRRELFPAYKQARKGTPKPIGYKALRSEVLTEEAAFMYHQIEADDLLGLFATMLDDVVIASGDKDLMQVPGVHVWLEPEKEPEPEEGLTVAYVDGNIIKTNTEEHAERFTYQQYLQGDSTDGVPGCVGIGEVRAKRIVDGFDIGKPVDCWEAIVRTYEEAWSKARLNLCDAPSFALQQARLVRVLRKGEYDFASHTVNLWNPPMR